MTFKKIDGVDYDITKRWEDGVEHDPRSYKLYKRISDLDFHVGSDSFGFKSGGNGDNGEHLMYLLDILFEEDDVKAKAQAEHLDKLMWG